MSGAKSLSSFLHKLRSKCKSKSSLNIGTESPAISMSSSLPEFQKQHTTGESYFHKVSGILKGGTGDVTSICLSASDIPSDGVKISELNKLKSRARKENTVYRAAQSHRLRKLVNVSGEKLGADLTIAVFGRLKRENELKKYKAHARTTQDEDESVDIIHK
ncbi:hypothetical protein ACHQM5_014451 [Ranunculus cassubicifolius]